MTAYKYTIDATPADVTSGVYVDIASITEVHGAIPGAQGPTGAAGPGVIAGGTAHQALTKINSTDYNTQWETVVPLGGTAGQVLSKINSTDLNTQWSTITVPTVPPFINGMRSSTWYAPPMDDVAQVTALMVDGRVYTQPINISQTITVSQLAVNVTTASGAGGVVSFGIYNMETDPAAAGCGGPKTLLASTGTVSVATSGIKRATLGANVQLTPGVYFIAALQTGAPSPNATVAFAVTDQGWLGFGDGAGDDGAATNAINAPRGGFGTDGQSSLPAPFPGPAVWGIRTPPRIAFKVFSTP